MKRFQVSEITWEIDYSPSIYSWLCHGNNQLFVESYVHLLIERNYVKRRQLEFWPPSFAKKKFDLPLPEFDISSKEAIFLPPQFNLNFQIYLNSLYPFGLIRLWMKDVLWMLLHSKCTLHVSSLIHNCIRLRICIYLKLYQIFCGCMLVYGCLLPLKYFD